MSGRGSSALDSTHLWHLQVKLLDHFCSSVYSYHCGQYFCHAFHWSNVNPRWNLNGQTIDKRAQLTYRENDRYSDVAATLVSIIREIHSGLSVDTQRELLEIILHEKEKVL